jgi:hypothetical protein
MKYVTTKHKDGRVSLTVYFGPDKDSDCYGVMISDIEAAKTAVDILTENLMKKHFGFTSFDMKMSLLNAFAE